MRRIILTAALMTATVAWISAEPARAKQQKLLTEVTDEELEAASQEFDKAMRQLEEKATAIWKDETVPEEKRRKLLEKLVAPYEKKADEFASLYEKYLESHPAPPDGASPSDIRLSPQAIITEIVTHAP